jgi:hypothetical protein
VLTWPLRDVLVAYLARCHALAAADYRTTRTLWALGVRFDDSDDCPPPPELLLEAP